MEFAPFDRRRYPALPVRDGYQEWAETYEGVVQDEMDLRLLARLESVDWAAAGRVLDLACGTGRIGAWLRARGVQRLDGLDFTPEMLARAAAKGVYDRVILADMLATGLPASSYDLVLEVLADEHLGEVLPLYQEAARLTPPAGVFVIVGYHPHFLMNGIPTHFTGRDGEPVAIESHVHLFSEHVQAAHRTGWMLVEMDEGLVDDAWIAKKPKWERYRSHPVSFAMVWRARRMRPARRSTPSHDRSGRRADACTSVRGKAGS
jgi:SAM-dependent methyltransferase